MRRTAVLFSATLALGSGGAAAQSPLVLLDAAHHNSVFRGRQRASVVRFLETSGFRTRLLEGLFSRDVLGDVEVAIVATALSARNALPFPFTQEQFNAAWSRPVPSAFSSTEIEILHEWVSEGGGLLLVFDHMPLAGAAHDLAAAFGFEVSDGYAVDPRKLTDLSGETVSEAASIVFRRSDQTLVDHPVTQAQGPAARIDSIATWTGSAFRIPADARSLLTLPSWFVSLVPDTAWVFTDATPREDVGGWSQGAVLAVGRGRVAVFAEAGILVSPEAMAASDKDSNPQVQNPQLLLNIVHWLSR